MGQIVFNGQKPKYCNLTAITTGSKKDYVIPSREVWLVDTTNSSKTNGSGKYDKYIIGDGSHTASYLATNTLMDIDNAQQIEIDSAPTSGSANAVSSGGVYQAIQSIDVSSQVSSKEDKSNKVTSFSSPTDTQYPSAKLVSDQLATKQDTISDLANIRNGAAAGITAIQSVTVGTTTTGAAGTNASVTNTGTTTEPVLSFTIPQGAQGIQGIQGPQGERGPQGNTGVQVDSVASIIHSIDLTATYAAADAAGADAVQDIIKNADDAPVAESTNLVKSGGVYGLYAKTINVFERNVTGWKTDIPIELDPGITYTITVTKESSSLTVLSLKDDNDSTTTLINNKVLANSIIEYTPLNHISSITMYSKTAADFKIHCDNDEKILLTNSDVINNMNDGGADVPLSAEMGKELNDKTFFLNYYYHPVSSGFFSDGDSSHRNDINHCNAILKNQDIASLSVKDGYEYKIYGKADNVRSSNRFTIITSDYITDKWVNTSSVAYLWIMIMKTDSSVIDCNELNSILIVEYNGAKTQFNKIYTQDDVFRLGRREDLAVNYVNGTISIDYGTRTEDESSTNFISEYIDVSKIAALSFVVSSKYSSTNFSPSLPVLWYDSNKNYIGHTNIQILTKDRKAIIGVPDAASYAVFSGKRTVEAIYRQDAIEAHYSISYKSVLGKLKKVSLIICHGQSLMLGADTTSSTVFPIRKYHSSLLTFSFTIGIEPQSQDNNYAGFETLGTIYNRESPRLGLGEMFIQTIAKENNINVEANEWENHLMLMPSPARGGASIETLSSDEEYANVEAFIRNAKRFCDEYGYELDAPAWIWFQGENNLGSQTPKDTYKAALLALHERICGSLSTIAGITNRPKCIIYQPSSQCIQSKQAADYGFSNGKLGVPTAFAELLAENDEFLAAAPTYILTPATSGGVYIHCDAESYNLLGAYAGYALKKYLIDGINVKGVVPLNFTVEGNTIKIKYNVPSPPLCIDTNWVREVAHYGYTCIKSDDTDIVTDVSVYWDTVTITCSESPVGCKLRYGLNGDRVYSADGYYGWSGRIYGGRGNIRDNQGNAICKEMPNGKIYPMHNWAYCFEKVLE